MKILISFLLFTNIYAGFEKGNGGDAVVCEKEYKGSKTFAYDYLEAEELAGIQIDFGRAESVDEMVHFTLNKLKALHPIRSELYKKWFETFWDETLQLRGKDLIDIPDSNLGAIPSGLDCEIVQTIVQLEPTLPWHRRYTVNMDIWDTLTNRAKAGLLLHELILRESREIGYVSGTSKVRYFNSVLSSKRFSDYELVEYVDLVRVTSMKTFQFENFSIFAQTKSDVWDDDKGEYELVKAEFRDGLFYKGFPVSQEQKFGPFMLSTSVNGSVYNTREKISYVLQDSVISFVRVDTEINTGLIRYGYEKGSVSLDKETQILTIVQGGIGGFRESQVSSKNFLIKFGGDAEVQFYPDGKLKTAKNIKEARVFFIGEWIEVKGKSIDFNLNQEVTRIY